ncbi:MAG: 2-oxoacid:acceptor oxidoreductase family protein [Syntrophorhabdales bacterium]|jgi:2-oxoglutarate ferredoxin oxidoreductase subunit gamma
MPWIRQIRFSGLGGQGVVLAGLLLGEAGAADGRTVTGSNSYGAQARGSGCKSEVVLSDGPIDFPHVTRADVLVAMSQSAYDQYAGEVTQDALILYDSSQVKPAGGVRARQLGAPATETALKKLKNKQVANIVLLGALVEADPVVSAEAVVKAIEKHVSPRFLALNLDAFSAGRELSRQSHG